MSRKIVTLKQGELTKQKDEMNQAVSIDAEWMVGPWKVGTAKYAGFEGKGYVAPNLGEKAPMHARINLHADSLYNVEVRSLIGGAHPDRALIVEVAGKKLKTTHNGKGPSKGKYVLESAGTVTLPAGVTDVKIYAVGNSIPVVDLITLSPVTVNFRTFLSDRF